MQGRTGQIINQIRFMITIFLFHFCYAREIFHFQSIQMSMNIALAVDERIMRVFQV